MPATMPWAESVEVILGIGVPVNKFILNQSVLDGTDVLDGNNEADVTQYVKSAAIQRGRSDNLAQFQAGSCSLILNNNSRIFDPINTASPYYDPATGTSGITPKRSITVKSQGETLFTGKIQDIDIEYDKGGTSEVSVIGIDGFADLAAATIETAITPSVEKSGVRLESILDLPEVGWTAGRNIDTGTQDLGAFTIDAATNALGYAQRIAEAEFGFLFIEGDGSLRFSERIVAVFPDDIVAEFNDDGTDIKYETLGISYGSEQMFNKVIASIEGGTAQIADDAASQSTYGILSIDLTETLLATDAQALSLAEAIVDEYSQPKYRFDDISATYNGKSSGQMTTLSQIELADFIQVSKSFSTGTPATVTQVTRCEQIRHVITPGSHRIELRLSPAILVYRMILDDPVYGLLDSGNAVG